MAKLNIQSGQVFGLLTVLNEVEPFILPSGQKNRAFLMKCDCGKETIIRLLHFSRGRTNSCGCLLGEHHESKYDGLYNSWRGMRWRCNSKNNFSFKHYGVKEIEVYSDWQSKFSVFLEWFLSNGWEDGLEIDRIDWNKGYHPDNCRFVNQIQQTNNREVTYRVTYKGKLYAFTDLLRDKGKLNQSPSIRARISRGWDVEAAIDTPIKIGNYKRKVQ